MLVDKKSKISIIYESLNFLAVFKPAGILTHPVPSKTTPQETLVSYLIAKYPEIGTVGDNPQNRPGIIHRLDKNTSGVLIIARNNHFFNYFKNLLQTHLVVKTYLALVYGEVKKDLLIEKPIGLISGTIKRSATAKKMKMIKPAVTLIKPLQIFEHENKKLTLLKVFPKTGRTHQIRVHLSSVSHPVVGDFLYGPKQNPFNLNQYFLHASAIEFTSENGKRLKIEADLPPELESLLTALKNKGTISQ